MSIIRDMRRGMLLVAVGTAALAASASAAMASPAEVEFGVGTFTPRDVTVDFQPDGNEVEFNRNDPGPDFHSITSVNGLFGIGPGGFAEFDVQASAGTFRYYCTNHGNDNDVGMAGVFAVRPIATEITGDQFKVTWADDESTTGLRYSVRYRVKGKDQWQSWIAARTPQSRRFGEKDRPVDVKPSKSYEFQARSEAAGKSAWSPKLTVAPGA